MKENTKNENLEYRIDKLEWDVLKLKVAQILIFIFILSFVILRLTGH